MEWQEARRFFGDDHVQGVGIEIGAGLNPIHHPGIEKLYFFDKRDPAEFEKYFGAPPAYELIDLEGVRAQYPHGIDFITCHHVIEHLDNPIPVIAEWAKLLKPRGVFYASLPSPRNVMEVGRMETPLRHIIEDWIFNRDSNSYESKEHIYSFVNACTACGGAVKPWYADNTVQDFTRFVLYDVATRTDHDLHWHTYSLETIRSVIELAFYAANVFGETLAAEETHDSHYVVMRKSLTGPCPKPLMSFRADMSIALARCDHLMRNIRPVG